MGFLMESSCISPIPLPHPRFLSSSSSPSQSVLIFSCNAAAFRRRRPPLASLHRDDGNDAGAGKRRAVLLVGISILPLFQLRAAAMAYAGQSESKTSKLNQEAEVAIKEDTASNPFLSLLNGLGIFSAGVLGALYALAWQENKAAEETIDSLKKQLKDKEAALVLKEKSFEARLQREQEEGSKQLQKAKEEQMFLVNQLNAANNTVTELGRELSSQKRLCEELKVQIESLQKNLTKAGEDKKSLEAQLKEKFDLIEVLQERINLLSLELKESEEKAQGISASVAEKEIELKNLNSTFIQTSHELDEAKAEILQLKDDLTINQKEMDSKISLNEELNSRIRTLLSERDGYMKKLDDILKDYDDFRSTSEARAAADAELLSGKEHEIQQLKEELHKATDELKEKRIKIANLTQECQDSNRMLDMEQTNVEQLRHEIEAKKKALEESRNRFSDLEKLLEESDTLCTKLDSEISKLQAEFKEENERHERLLDGVKRDHEVLTSDLQLKEELLKKTEDELQGKTHDLRDLTEKNHSLQKELIDVYQKAETTSKELEEEKKIVLALNQNVEAMGKQMLKDKEARKSFETDLEEAVKSLDEMNKNTFSLSQELEGANARFSSLEDEKEMLLRSLAEAKNALKEAQENMEDAHNLVVSLGKERETLEKKVKKLEEDLASAKGEILRMRSQPNALKVVNNSTTDGKPQIGNDNKVSVKRGVARKRKSNGGS